MQEQIELLTRLKTALEPVMTDDAIMAINRCIELAHSNQPRTDQTIERLQGKVEAYERAFECLGRKF